MSIVDLRPSSVHRSAAKMAAVRGAPFARLCSDPCESVLIRVQEASRCPAARGCGILLHGDHLGSTSLVTSDGPTATVASRVLYYPYGETRWITGTLTTEYQYTGQRAEHGLGLYDYVARFYDPALGRFISADTIVPEPGNPQSMNRFSYVLGNPMRFVDPDGHDPCTYYGADSAACIVYRAWLEGPSVSFEGGWSMEHRAVVLEGASAVAQALQRSVQGDRTAAIVQAYVFGGDPKSYSSISDCWELSTRGMFQKVYGTVRFDHIDTYPRTPAGGIYWAETFTRRGQEIIEVNNWAFDADNFTSHNPVHELGHAFAHRTGGPDGFPRVPYDDLANAGFPAFERPWPWAQSSLNTSSEDFADMFLNWVFSNLDTRLNRWMDANMSRWIALAIAETP